MDHALQCPMDLESSQLIMRSLRRHAEISGDSYAPNTWRALKSDIRLFQAWCAQQGYRPFPAEPRVVGDFLAAMAAGEAVKTELRDRHGRMRTTELTGMRRPATIERYLASIAHFHRAAGLPFDRQHDEIRQRLRGIRRCRGSRQRQAFGLRWPDLLRLLPPNPGDRPAYAPLWEHLPVGLRGPCKAEVRLEWLTALRARALILTAYDTMCRRAELVALRIEHLCRAAEGRAILIAQAKADPEGQGRYRPLRPRTVAAIEAWLAAIDWSHREMLLEQRGRKRSHAAILNAPSVVAQGPLFRSIHRSGRVRQSALPASHVPKIIKSLAAAAGFPSEITAGLSGHSTRIGAAQDLKLFGASVLELQFEGGWRDPRMPGRYTQAIDVNRGAMARMARAQEEQEVVAGCDR